MVIANKRCYVKHTIRLYLMSRSVPMTIIVECKFLFLRFLIGGIENGNEKIKHMFTKLALIARFIFSTEAFAEEWEVTFAPYLWDVGETGIDTIKLIMKDGKIYKNTL